MSSKIASLTAGTEWINIPRLHTPKSKTSTNCHKRSLFHICFQEVGGLFCTVMSPSKSWYRKQCSKQKLYLYYFTVVAVPFEVDRTTRWKQSCRNSDFNGCWRELQPLLLLLIYYSGRRVSGFASVARPLSHFFRVTIGVSEPHIWVGFFRVTIGVSKPHIWVWFFCVTIGP